MAKCGKPIIPAWLYPGLIAVILILGITLSAFTALWIYAPPDNLYSLLSDHYLWRVVGFTFWQALLSVLLSVIPAIFIAQALFRHDFLGRRIILRLCTMTFILPVLVSVFGMMTVYGRHGWLAQFCHYLGIDYNVPVYGLQGILFAHVFYNLPLALRLFLQSLQSIPVEQQQLSAQLGLTYWQHFRFIEWPALRRQIFPTAALIFMLCFSSFAIVLALGGGPKNTTIELAIYQAVRDFDLHQAALLALLQLAFCLVILLISQHLTNPLSVGVTYLQRWQNTQHSLIITIVDSCLIILTLLLLVPPLVAVIIEGIQFSTLEIYQQAGLWQALWTSVRIAICASLIAVILSMMLLWSSRELSAFWAQKLELSGMIILAMPGMVLATGFFLLLNDTIDVDILVILTNALMAIPFVLKILDNPMNDLAQRYNLLSQSLGIQGINRLWWVELKALRAPIRLALAFACIISIGDFGIVAILGNQDFVTLPYYLFQQMGSYRNNDGAVTACLLLLLCFLLFSIIERHDYT